MARPLTAIARPKCSTHPARRVVMDGAARNYSAAHRRKRWRCVAPDGSYHRFTPKEPPRHPTGHTDACVECDHVYSVAEGPRTGRNATFTYREVADVLIDIGRGATYRDAAARARRAAKRTDTREANLVAGWLDAFGSVIVEHFETKQATDWPIAIAIDSKPLRRPGFDERKGKARVAENGEIFGVMDMSVSRQKGTPFLLRLAGGKDAVSWLTFFAETGLGGAPAWIVADQDRGIEKAVPIAFPGAVLYRCEGHLLMNGREAYLADKLPEWVRKSPEEIAGPAAYGAPKGKARLWKHSDLWFALEQCLHSTEHWRRFVALVDAEVPESKWNLRLWIEEVGDLVTAQEELRKRFPGMPRATGSLEAAVIDKVTHHLGPRGGFFRNRRRLDVTLGLMRLELAGQASPTAYTAVLRAHYKTNGWRSGAAWRRNRDLCGTSSIDDLILMSDVAAAAEREREQNAARKARTEAQRDEQRELREAAGLDASTGRRRRPDGPRLDAYRSVAGLLVSDLPDLMAIWDFAANKAIGLDPYATTASSIKRALWACPVHESHRWDATIKDKATYPVGCPFCMDRRACPTNSVRTLYPDIAKEWHPTRNRDTPDDYIKGANKKTWWKCAKRGHIWEARINARTIYGQGCPKCAQDAQKVRERDTTARRHRRNRQLAKLAPLLVDPNEEPLF